MIIIKFVWFALKVTRDLVIRLGVKTWPDASARFTHGNFPILRKCTIPLIDFCVKGYVTFHHYIYIYIYIYIERERERERERESTYIFFLYELVIKLTNDSIILSLEVSLHLLNGYGLIVLIGFCIIVVDNWFLFRGYYHFSPLPLTVSL